MVPCSLVVVGCRRKWAIRGSGSGGHEPFSPSHLGSEVLRLGVGAHGWVVRFGQPSVRSPSWSWLPIVVAPGCLGHPTSTVSERRSCLMLLNVTFLVAFQGFLFIIKNLCFAFFCNSSCETLFSTFLDPVVQRPITLILHQRKF